MPFNAMQSIKNDKQPQDSKFNIVWPLMFCLLANQDSLNLYIQNTWVAILPRGVFSNLCLPTADMTDNYVTGEICHQSWCALRQKPEVHLHLITHPNRNIVSYETESQTNINRVPYVFPTLFLVCQKWHCKKKQTLKNWICSITGYFYMHLTLTFILTPAFVKFQHWLGSVCNSTKMYASPPKKEVHWKRERERRSFFLESRPQNET